MTLELDVFIIDPNYEIQIQKTQEHPEIRQRELREFC